MTDQAQRGGTAPHGPAGAAGSGETVSGDLEDLAQQVADQVESFLLALRAIARGEAEGGAVPLLLLEVSQVLLAGARLGVQADFTPATEFQPDAGPDPDLDGLRLRLATLLDGVDEYTEAFDPYVDPPELVSSRLSDDLAATASDLAHGLRHFRAGRTREALWWWQFSYVSSWGSQASAALRALQSVVTHDRLDVDAVDEVDELDTARALLHDQLVERERG